MKKTTIPFILLLLSISLLQSQNSVSTYQIESIHLGRQDSVFHDKYTIHVYDVNENSVEVRFNFEIVSHDSTTLSPCVVINDLLNQKLSCVLLKENYFIDLLNFEDLELKYTYPHMIGMECGSSSIQDKIINYINNQMPYLKVVLLPDFLKLKEYTDYSPNGLELNFRSKRENTSSSMTFLLDNALKDEYCYQHFDCVVNEQDRHFEYEKTKAIEAYEGLSNKERWKTNLQTYLSTKLRSQSNHRESQIDLYGQSLQTCLNLDNEFAQSIKYKNEQEGSMEVFISRDNLYFNKNMILYNKINIEKSIWTVKQNK